MTEIIKRKMKLEKTTIEPDSHKLQVSFNSDGRLTFRLIPAGKENEDILIVFNAWDTKTIKDFIKYKMC